MSVIADGTRSSASSLPIGSVPLSLGLHAAASSSAFALARRAGAADRWRSLQHTQFAERIQQLSAPDDPVDDAAPLRDMTWFDAHSVSLLTLTNPDAPRTHSGATMRWQVDTGVRLSIWPQRASLAFKLDAALYELRFVWPERERLVMFVQPSSNSCVLRIVLQSPPSVYCMSAAGKFARAVPPLPSDDHRFARCRVLDLLFVGESAQKVLSSPALQHCATGKSVLADLPTPASLLQPMTGWSEFDGEFAGTPFAARYLLHCLIAAEQLVFTDGRSARQIAVAISQAEPRFVHAHLLSLLSSATPVKSAELLTALSSQVIGSALSSAASVSAPPLLSRHVFVTPLRILPQRPELDCGDGNRILRRYAKYRDRFIRVTFVEESMGPLATDAARDLQDAWLRPIMRNGLLVAGSRFVFLAYSNSQLREHTAYFYCESAGGFGEAESTASLAELPPTAASIRASVGDLSRIPTPGKAAARLAQAFSSTKQTIRLQPEQVTKLDDVCTADGQLCFTDGCGLISQRLAAQVSRAWDGALQHVPSAFQIRYQGAKGVVSVCPAALEKSLLGSFDLALRPSLIKFVGNPSDSEVEVCSIASTLPFYLNRSIIPVLVAGGVEEEAFIDLFKRCSAQMHAARTDSKLAVDLLRAHGRQHPDLIELLEAGHDVRREPYIRSFVGCVIDKLIVDMCCRFRMPIEHQSARLMGIADETGTMPEGTVFFQTRDPARSLPVAGSSMAVGRDPCLHPGDIRVLRMCDLPASSPLRDLFDVLVFSVQGSRPEANKMSGGDLDGDLFFVIWDPRFIPSGQHEPMSYDTTTATQPGSGSSGSSSSSSGGGGGVSSVSIDAMSDFFVSYMSSSSVGAIADAHAAHADQSALGVRDPSCLRLAELHSAAVDFAKTGQAVILPRVLQPRVFPLWMKRNSAAHGATSSSALSQLFAMGQALLSSDTPDSSDSVALPPAIRLPAGSEIYLDDALGHYADYSSDMSQLLHECHAATEVQLLSGLTAANLRASKARAHASGAARAEAALRELRSKYLQIFQRGMSSSSPQHCLKAAAWYHTAHCSRSVPRFLSFAWLAVEPMCLLASQAISADSSSASQSDSVGSSSPPSGPDSACAKASALYRAGDFALSLRAFEDAWQQSHTTATDDVKASICVGRAECLVALHQPADAMIWCEQALRMPGAHSAEARVVLSQAQALALPTADAAADQETFQRLFDMTRDLILQTAHSNLQDAALDPPRSRSMLSALQRLPLTRKLSSLDSIRTVRNDAELSAGVRRADTILILAPGEYSTPLVFTHDVILIADQRCGGRVRIKSGLSHAVTVHLGTCVMSGLTIVQGVPHPQYSAVCVTSGLLVNVKTDKPARLGPVRLLMADCVISDFNEVGVLADGEDVDATIMRCTFDKTSKQAIEVRRGASLTVLDTNISQAGRSGICVYGGAKRLRVVRTQIKACAAEGILAQGSMPNAPSLAQAQARESFGLGPDGLPRQASVSADRRISEAAVKWAREQGIGLEVSIEQCSIERCGNYGLSLDVSTVHADVLACRFLHNRPINVYIKGEVHARVSACHFIHGSRSGVQIGFNYDASVHLRHNAFVGEANRAIVNELADDTRMLHVVRTAVADSIRTKAPVLEGNITGCELHSMVSMADLRLRCPILNRLRPGAAGSKHAPLEQACSWSRRVLRYDAGAEYYAVGNTFGFSLLSSSVPIVPSARVDLLFAQARDIRHIVATAIDLQSHLLAAGLSKEAVLVVHEESISLLARIVLMLRMIACGVRTEIVIAIWANVSLSAEEHTVLSLHLRQLASGDFPVWLRVPSMDLLVRLRAVFEEWSTSTVSKATVERARERLPQELKRLSVQHTMTAIASQQPDFFKLSPSSLSRLLIAYAETGSFPVSSASLRHANVTMLESPGLRDNLYFSSSIFRAVKFPIITRSAASERADTWLAQQLRITLEPQFAAIRALLTGGRCCVSVLSGHMRDLAFELPRMFSVDRDDADPLLFTGFDRADWGNYGDYDSLLATLLLANRLLKPSEASVFFLHSIRWWMLRPCAHLSETTAAELLATRIVRQTCGFHPSMAPALLQLRLTQSSRSCHLLGRPGTLHMAWQRAAMTPMADSQTKHLLAAQLVRFLSAPWRRTPALSSFLLGAGTGAVLRCIQLISQAAANPASSLRTTCERLIQSACSDIQLLHSAELRTLSAVQSFDPSVLLEDAVLVLRFTCQVPLRLLKHWKELPLQLVLSDCAAPAHANEPRGGSAAVAWLCSSAVVQLFDSLSFDSDSMEVQLFLLHSELQRYPSHFLTLCATSDSPRFEGENKLQDRCAVLAPSVEIASVTVVDEFNLARWSQQKPECAPAGDRAEIRFRRSWNRAKDEAKAPFARGHMERALQLYQDGLHADERILNQLLLHLACCAMQLKRAHEALRSALTLCAIDPSCFEAWMLAHAAISSLDTQAGSASLSAVAEWFKVEARLRCPLQPSGSSSVCDQLTHSYPAIQLLQSTWVQCTTEPTESVAGGGHPAKGPAMVAEAVSLLQVEPSHSASSASSSAADDAFVLLRRGEQCLAQPDRDWSAAYSHFHVAVTSSPLAARAVLLTNRAQCLAKLTGRQLDRLLASTGAVLLNPSFAKAYLRQAEALMATAQHAMAARACELGVARALPSDTAVLAELTQLQSVLRARSVPFSSSASGSANPPSMLHVPMSAAARGSADRSEEMESLAQARHARESLDSMARAFGIDKNAALLEADPLLNVDVPRFDQELITAGEWPLCSDEQQCIKFVRNAREKACWQRVDELHIVETKQDKVFDAIEQHLLQRLGVPDKQRVRWWTQAPPGSVQFLYDLMTVPPAMGKSCLSFANHAFRPMILARGKINVAVGTRHADLSALCFAEGLQPDASSEPTRFVGFGPHAACAAKAVIIIQLLSTTPLDSSAASSSSASVSLPVVLDAVVEIWFSASLQRSSSTLLRKAITEILEQQNRGARKHESAIVEILRKWMVAHIPLQLARERWIEHRPHKSVSRGANLRELVDRLAFCRYALSGDVFPASSDSVGNPCMFLTPSDPEWLRESDESIFDRIALDTLLNKRQSSANIVVAAAECLRDEIRRLHVLLSSGAVLADFRLGSLLDERDRAATARAIHQLQPWSIFWSNACDHMSPRAFHELARASSGDEDTIHFAISLNWTRDVKGSWIFDYGSVEHRTEIMQMTRAYNKQLLEGKLFKATVPQNLYLLPPIEHMMNLSAAVLAFTFDAAWRDAFFDPKQAGGFVHAASGSFQQLSYNALGSRSAQLWFTFTYDPTIRMEVPDGKQLCSYPNCKARACERPTVACKRCWNVLYCSADCQQQHRREHRSQCRPGTPF